MCSKEGFQVDEPSCESKKKNRLDTRTGCKVLIRFSIKEGIWSITYVNLDHNHELASPEERQFLRSGRHVSNAFGAVMSSMVDAGIGATKSYFFLTNEAGGAENVGFTKKDAVNYLQRKKEEIMEVGDA